MPLVGDQMPSRAEVNSSLVCTALPEALGRSREVISLVALTAWVMVALPPPGLPGRAVQA